MRNGLLLLLPLLAACGDPRQGPTDRDAGSTVSDTDSSVPSQGTEECNGLDDNGDGRVDETCACEIGQTQACYPASFEVASQERCANGSQTCTSDGEFGKWGDCQNAVRCLPQED